MIVRNITKLKNLIESDLLFFAKKSFYLIILQLLRLVIQITILVIYSRELSIEDYGKYQSIWLHLNLFSVITLFGIPTIILTFSFEDIKCWFYENISKCITLFFGLYFAVFVYFLFYNSNYNSTIKNLLLIWLVIQNVGTILDTIAVKQAKIKVLFFTNFIFTLFFFTLHILVLKNSYSLIILMIWLIILAFIKIIVLFSYLKINKNRPLNNSIKKIGKQFAFIGLFDLISVITKWVDKWLILLFLSVAEFAKYYNGSYEIPIFGLLLTSVGNVVLVEISKNRNEDLIKTKTIFSFSTLLLSSIVFPCFAFLVWNHSTLFTLVFGYKYFDSIPLFFISLFIIPVRICNYTAVIQVNLRNDLILKGAFFDFVIAIILALFLYPYFRLEGIAASFVITTYLQAYYYLWHTSKLLGKKISFFFSYNRFNSDTFYINISFRNFENFIIKNKFKLLSYCKSSNLYRTNYFLFIKNFKKENKQLKFRHFKF